MTFGEELRNQAMTVCSNKRYEELYLKMFVEQSVLDSLAVKMKDAAKDGKFVLSIPLQSIVSEHWKEVANKDYRSSDKRKFDEEIAEYLTLYFDGVRVGTNHFGTNGDYIYFEWR